jgi:hypothetical protein
MTQPISNKLADGSDKKKAPDQGGAQARNSQEWGGGSKGSNGPVTAADRANEQSSAKS